MPDGLTRREVIATGAAAALTLASPAAAGPRRSATRLLPSAAEVAARGTPPGELGILDGAALLQARRISAVELTEACLTRAHAVRPELNAWIRLYAELAHDAARAADGRLSARAIRRTGRRAPLVCGVPLAHKDIVAIGGVPLTASSKILAGNVAAADSAIHRRLAYFGMVAIGHTQTHEFAAGNFTPQCANPWDPARTPGGSSGGSAIALASRSVPAATGTDTLGSLRIPAGLCGVTTIKPTRGVVSLEGVIPLAPSFDHAGPMARSAADAALLLSYMRSGEMLLTRPASGAQPLAGLRVGMPSGSFGGVSIDAGIAARVDAYAHELEKLGATLVAFDAPRSPADNLSSSQGLEFWMTVPGREIDAYHRAWFPQRAADYTSDVAFTLSLLRAGNTVPLDPASGRAAIRTLRAGWETAFSTHRLDLVLQPAAVIAAPKREDAQTKTQSIGDAMVVWDYLGWPVICLPAGRGSDGLPVGVQLAARPGAERLLCRTAITAEQHLPYWQQRPPAV